MGVLGRGRGGVGGRDSRMSSLETFRKLSLTVEFYVREVPSEPGPPYFSVRMRKRRRRRKAVNRGEGQGILEARASPKADGVTKDWPPRNNEQTQIS